MKTIRSQITQTRRDAWIEVNLNNIEHNLNEVKKILNPDVEIMAVVKADAYGHGATMVAKTLSASGISMFGVASVDEGIQLRLSDIKQPILILGPTPIWALQSAVEHSLDVTIFSQAQLNECVSMSKKLGKKINVHIKVDTGMHRIGIDYKNAPVLITSAQQCNEINLIGIFSHLACAENRELSEIQIERWENILKNITDLPPYIHLSNSAGINAYKNIQYNLVRIGLELYGLSPDLAPKTLPLSLKQALSLKSRITHLHKAYKGEGISYGHIYKVKDKEITVATIPTGYADGVSRRLSNKLFGILNDHIVPQIGTITMDQMMLDVTGVPNIGIGSIVTLLGYTEENFISIDSWAKELSTINYEIPCLLKVRLPRVYTNT